MKREQLTNVTTDAQCQELAREAAMLSRSIVRERINGMNWTRAHYDDKTAVTLLADRIIALRSQQVHQHDCLIIESGHVVCMVCSQQVTP